MCINFNRRRLLNTILTGALLAPFKPGEAAVEKLAIADPQAVKLGYVEDASKTDVKHFPTYKTGQVCANCTLVQMRLGFWRPCKAFPGKVISAKGWCAAWVAKTYRG